MNDKSIATQFNSNLLRMFSLNKLIDDCNEYSRLSYWNGYNVEYLKLWNNTLNAVYREICPKLKEEEKTRIRNLFVMTCKIGRIYQIKNTPDGTIKILNYVRFKQHFNLLKKVEEELRILADKKGMLMTNKDLALDIIGEE